MRGKCGECRERRVEFRIYKARLVGGVAAWLCLRLATGAGQSCVLFSHRLLFCRPKSKHPWISRKKEKGKRCYIVVTIVAPVLNPGGEIFNVLSYRLFVLFLFLSVLVAGSEVAVLSNGRR